MDSLSIVQTLPCPVIEEQRLDSRPTTTSIIFDRSRKTPNSLQSWPLSNRRLTRPAAECSAIFDVHQSIDVSSLPRNGSSKEKKQVVPRKDSPPPPIPHHLFNSPLTHLLHPFAIGRLKGERTERRVPWSRPLKERGFCSGHVFTPKAPGRPPPPPPTPPSH